MALSLVGDLRPMYVPARGGWLERYEVADGAGVLGIANEQGDLVAYVERADGTRGQSYGGPVYDPPEFTNVCDRVPAHSWFPSRDWCTHLSDMTAAERATADVFARRVGWMP
jgi:hypothetical protein